MRLHLLTILGFVTTASLVFSACTANVKENCVGGECDADGLPQEVPMVPDPGPVMCSPPPSTGDVPCEVFDVLERNCHRCHNTAHDSFGAPFALLTFEDTQQVFFKDILRYQRMKQVIQPNGVPSMPQGAKMTDADFKILDDWLTKCAAPTADGMGCECPNRAAPGQTCVP